MAIVLKEAVLCFVPDDNLSVISLFGKLVEIPASPSGVELLVGGFQALAVNVGVDLGGCDIGMALGNAITCLYSFARKS